MSQTNADDFEQARRAAKGFYPNRRIIQKVRDESHPSIATYWARVQRACNFPPGAKYQAAKEEVCKYCESCIVCQKLKPAREKLQQRVGSIKRRPFTEYAFDIIVLSEPDENGYRYILTVIDSFSQADDLFPLREASATEVKVQNRTVKGLPTIFVNDQYLMTITYEDVGQANPLTLANQISDDLKQHLQQAKQERQTRFLIQQGEIAAVGTLAMIIISWGVRRWQKRLSKNAADSIPAISKDTAPITKLLNQQQQQQLTDELSINPILTQLLIQREILYVKFTRDNIKNYVQHPLIPHM
jgi:hypothetical protein